MKRLVLSLAVLTGLLRAGEYADAFLLASFSPYSQALGKSNVALPSYSGYTLNNPASNGFGYMPQARMTYHRYGDLLSQYSAAGQHPLGENWLLSAQVIHAGVGDIYARPSLSGLDPLTRRDSVRYTDHDTWGTLQHREDALLTTIGRKLKFNIDLGWKFFEIPCELPVGLTVKYIDKVLEGNRGIGSGIDLGTAVRAELKEVNDLLAYTELYFGYVVRDILNTPVYWETRHQDAIKRSVVTGMALVQPIPSAELVFTVSTSTNAAHQNLRQYGLQIGFKEVLNARLGHDGNEYSLGLGLAFKKFIIDYSFSQHELAGAQKFGVVYTL